jgi:hypothetical protein
MNAPAPAPPQGPGVYPPFPAPPVEGKGLRLGLGLGIGAAVLVLVCGGGIAALIGLSVVGERAVAEQADIVLGDYFGALEDKRYDDAYDQLCEQEQQKQSEAEFTREATDRQIVSHQIGDVTTGTSLEIVVPVTVTYADGRNGNLRVQLAQGEAPEDENTAARLKVCGVQ